MSVRRTHAAISDGHPRLKVSRQAETMGSARNNVKILKKSDKWRLTPESSAVEENIQAMHVQTTLTPEQLRDLMKKTDLRQLTNRMEEVAEPVVSAPSMSQRQTSESDRPFAKAHSGPNDGSHPRGGRS